MIYPTLSTKFKFILPALVLLSTQAFSQTKNNISLVYGSAANTVDIHGAIGDFGYSPESGTNFGLSYTRYMTRHFSLEQGCYIQNLMYVYLPYRARGANSSTMGM